MKILKIYAYDKYGEKFEVGWIHEGYNLTMEEILSLAGCKETGDVEGPDYINEDGKCFYYVDAWIEREEVK